MSRTPQRPRLEPWESQAHPGKLPEISCLPERQPIVSQLSEDQKLPTLTSDPRYLDSRALKKCFGGFSFEHSWKNAVIKTKKIKQEYTSAYGLRETSENIATPSLTKGSERYLAISNSTPVVQKTKGANSYPVSSSYINEDYSLPPLYSLPSTSSQYCDSFYKSRGDTAMDSIHRRESCSWKPVSVKAPGLPGETEEGAERLKKSNQCSSLSSFTEGSKFKSDKGYHYTDPFTGAPPQYIQRLSQLAALECETIHQERTRRVKRTRKHNIT
ncbi:putative uncharacterized protein C8orf89 homolog isoform X2 [Paroedura picta]|uniref:putative uncharacterized protein C8orf89 homolog isoform X2 n=1 Tax=Paroedura picta TaxID=143630 RepID=UPI00405782D4